MGITKPETSAPLDKFSEAIGEDKPFRLIDIRTVEANSQDYGKGEMVVMKVAGQENELGIWGTYLLAQAKAAEPTDLNREYVVTRKVVPEFSKREVKCLVPVNEQGEQIPF